jgi:hypothetical protein
VSNKIVKHPDVQFLLDPLMCACARRGVRS